MKHSGEYEHNFSWSPVLTSHWHQLSVVGKWKALSPKYEIIQSSLCSEITAFCRKPASFLVKNAMVWKNP